MHPVHSERWAHALLRWYVDSGLDTIEAADATDFGHWPTVASPLLASRRRRATPNTAAAALSDPRSAPSQAPSPDAVSTDDAVAAAAAASAAANSVEALRRSIEQFAGCPLKPGATHTVVFDGIPRAPLLVIGEAPGRDEDRIGKPFVGRAGQLLDRMLAAIGFSRQPDDGRADVCITNAIYWRPPGNRTPTKAEIAICHPFLTRFIALCAPRAILLAGNVPNQTLFPGANGIMRSRGQWRGWPGPNGEIPVLPVFHPAFLLRQPQHKRLAWTDFLSLARRLQP